MSVILKKFKLNSYAFVFQMKEHKEIKNRLLDLIKITDQHTIRPDKTCNDFISKTDWKFSKIPERLYAMEFSKILEPYITKMLLELSMDEATIHNMWFQSYYKKDAHDWHIHEGTHWTNVYFLELPDTKFKTELYDSFNKKIINNIEVKNTMHIIAIKSLIKLIILSITLSIINNTFYIFFHYHNNTGHFYLFYFLQ